MYQQRLLELEQKSLATGGASVDEGDEDESEDTWAKLYEDGAKKKKKKRKKNTDSQEEVGSDSEWGWKKNQDDSENDEDFHEEAN